MSDNASQPSRSARRRAGRIILKEHLDIGSCRELQETLQRYLAKGVDININGAGVAHVDTAALQLLLAFRRQVRDNGRNANWQAPSEALAKTAALLGLSAELELADTAC